MRVQHVAVVGVWSIMNDAVTHPCCATPCVQLCQSNRDIYPQHSWHHIGLRHCVEHEIRDGRGHIPVVLGDIPVVHHSIDDGVHEASRGWPCWHAWVVAEVLPRRWLQPGAARCVPQCPSIGFGRCTDFAAVYHAIQAMRFRSLAAVPRRVCALCRTLRSKLNPSPPQ